MSHHVDACLGPRLSCMRTIAARRGDDDAESAAHTSIADCRLPNSEPRFPFPNKHAYQLIPAVYAVAR
jgi:hypothetical protein